MSAPSASALPQPGERLGRYTLLARVGEGRMGVVFAAFDERLDRKVALKLLHTSSEALLLEARTLARLAHPNVVAVYDAQDFHGRLAIAMEFVPGENLRQWLASARRSPAQTLAVLIEAGRGLSAAHAAGVLHRDFKADNVLVGSDGRARVTDFGSSAVGETDARADQRAFCATLYEALTGQPPSAHLCLDGVAPRVAQVISRGLSPDSTHRFESMDALLVALAPPPKSPSWPRYAAAAVVAALGLGGWAINARNERRALECSGAPERLKGVWDDATRTVLRDHFARSKASFAAGAWAVTERGLDSWAKRWAWAHKDACEATRRRNEQSTAVLDLRVACFEQLRTQAHAVVQVLATADDAVIGKAPRAVAELKDAGACADVAALRSTVPLSPDKHPARELLLTRLADLTARRSAGKYAGIVEETHTLVNDAKALGWQPLLADALIEQSWALDVTGDAEASWQVLQDAALAAEAGRSFNALAKAYALLIYATADLGKPTDVALLHRHALAVLAQAPNLEREAQLESYYGFALRRQGKVALALEHGQRSVEIARTLSPPLPLTLAAAANNLALTMGALNRAEEARALMREAIGAQVQVLGPDHPDVGMLTVNLGLAEYERGAFEEALAVEQKGLQILERGYGGDHLRVAIAQGAVGKTLVELGRIDEAIALETRALAMRERLFGKASTDYGRMLAYRAEAQLAARRHQLALTDYAAALEVFKTSVAPGHSHRIEALIGAARSQLALQRPREALALAAEAQKAIIPADADPQLVAFVDLVAAQAEIAAGLPKAPALERATKAWALLKTDPTLGSSREDIDAWFARQ